VCIDQFLSDDNLALERKEETREKMRALQEIRTDTIGNLSGHRLYFYCCPRQALLRIATQ
jgi:hypothetical protein